jgi:hypothetical protein
VVNIYGEEGSLVADSSGDHRGLNDRVNEGPKMQPSGAGGTSTRVDVRLPK